MITTNTEGLTTDKKQKIAKILFKIGAVKFDAFTLSSGKASPYYIDLRLVPDFPGAYHEICILTLFQNRLGF